MAKLTKLKLEVVEKLLVTVREEMQNMKNTNYQRRMYLMVEHSLAGGETAWAESMLRNFLGKFDLANLLTWINEAPRKSRINVNDPGAFWTDSK